MKITVTGTATKLPTLLWGKRYTNLTEDKEVKFYRFTIQNLGKINVFIEIWEDATVDEWYKLYPWNEVEIQTNNINKISFISESWSNDNIRIITT